MSRRPCAATPRARALSRCRPPPTAAGHLTRNPEADCFSANVIAVINALRAAGVTDLRGLASALNNRGACNPTFAHKALQAEDKIGTMLPCNVIVQETGEGRVEISAVDPVASMQAVKNPKLASIAGEVRDLLKQVVADL